MNMDFINHKYFPLFAVAALFVLLYLYFLSQRNFNIKNGFSNTSRHVQQNMLIYGALVGLAILYTVAKQYFEFATYEISDPAKLRIVQLSVSKREEDVHLFRQLSLPYNQDQPRPEVKVIVGMKLKYNNSPEIPLTLKTNDSLKPFRLYDQYERTFKGEQNIQELIRSYGDYIYCYDIYGESGLPLNRDIIMDENDTIPRMDTTGATNTGEYDLMVQVFFYKSSPTEFSISAPTTLYERVNYTNPNIPIVSNPPGETQEPQLYSPLSPNVRINLQFDNIVGI